MFPQTLEDPVANYYANSIRSICLKFPFQLFLNSTDRNTKSRQSTMPKCITIYNRRIGFDHNAHDIQ